MIYRWKAHEKKISKSSKRFCPASLTSCSTQKLIHGPKNRKIGCSLHSVVSCAIGKRGTLKTDVEPSAMSTLLSVE